MLGLNFPLTVGSFLPSLVLVGLLGVGVLFTYRLSHLLLSSNSNSNSINISISNYFYSNQPAVSFKCLTEYTSTAWNSKRKYPIPVWMNPGLYPLVVPFSGVTVDDTEEFGLIEWQVAEDCRLLHSGKEQESHYCEETSILLKKAIGTQSITSLNKCCSISGNHFPYLRSLFPYSWLQRNIQVGEHNLSSWARCHV